VIDVLLERVDANVLSDELDALEATIEPDLLDVADHNAIDLDGLDLDALDKPLPPDQRPGLDRQDVAIVIE